MELKLSTNIIKDNKELDKEWDTIIIGGGPAGYSAGLYCGRYKLKTLIITKDIGGLLNETDIIDDYPAVENITGPELARRFKSHADKYNVSTLLETVTRIEKKDDENFIVYTSTGKEFISKVVIIATGSQRKRLGVPGENLKGVSYCAECDAPLFKDKIVGVIGGGNSAFHDAEVLAQHAKEVYIIHRRDEFKADPVYIEELKNNEKIKFILNKVVSEIKGHEKVEEVTLQDTKTNEKTTLKLDGLFIAIGLTPLSEIVKDLNVNTDPAGHIIVNDCSKTNVKGLLAAGDVTNQICNLRQIVTAAAQGTTAALSAFLYIKTKKW
ncbi:thioredoxin-disulfide reductase [Nanobdella aerobiophila]|uniref:Thioredoxin-disulfide reductase n=1 Tax=Nanobdella aerobiophila TaxID=2586965 RepID=A0A915SSX9_9ARCH|nr:FAD-dependent oxidoreductase [Nanobdella aerobiophila]BBL45696.1 thioredoxin-disulfide reductase [Nanobdella aerobiophila]